jgi:excisionase family DNA binding protein
MSMVGTLSPPTNARYSPDDTPGSSAPSAPETSPSMGNFIDAQHHDPHPGRLAYSVDEAARLTGLSRDLLYDEMRRGNLAYVKVGRRLITRQHLNQFLGIAS